MLCIKLHPLKSKMHPPLNRSCTPSEPKLHPLTRFLSKLESFAIKKAVKSLISRLFCVFGRFQFLPEKCRTVAFAPRIIRIHLTRRKSENSGENRRFSEKRFLRANNAILGETEPFASKRIHQNDSHSLCKNR